MRLELIAKEGPNEIVHLVGCIEASKENFSLADAEKIIDTEQFLERLLGFRFHINQVN